MNKFVLGACFLLSSMVGFSLDRTQIRGSKSYISLSRRLKNMGHVRSGCAAVAPTKKTNMFPVVNPDKYRYSRLFRA